MFGAGRTQLFVIVSYLLLLLVVGFLASRLFRGTKKDYQLASHSIGPFLLLMSLFGTTMTAFALVGSTGESFGKGIGVYGMLASASGIVHSLCFFVVGIQLWKLGRRNGYTTQIGFFRDRLDSDWIGLLFFPIIVGLIIPYLLIGVMASGITIQSLTAHAFPDFEAFKVYKPGTEEINPGLSGGIPPWLGSLGICLVVLSYVFFGGMRGTAWANAFQTAVFMVLGVVTFCMIAFKLGGQDSLLENFKTISSRLELDKSTRVDMDHAIFITYMFIPLSVGMFPHVFQHWLTAKSSKSFKLPIVCHPLFIMIVWAPCVLIGVWATTELPAGTPPLPTLPNGAVNQNAILPFLVNVLTNPWLAGLLAAGILAAIMSSLDSQFLCIGTIFSNDIVIHYFGEDRFSDRQQVWITRGFIVVIVAVTYGLSLLDYRSVFTMAIWCFTGYASLFPILFAAIYWRRLTKAGVVISILVMVASWGYLFWQSNFGAKTDYAIVVPDGGDGIHLMPVALTFLLTLVTMVGVSLFTKPPSDDVLERFFPS
jgi:SSS family solute:Na+ symporter